MRELGTCPFCNKSLSAKLIAGFFFCEDCEVAVRQEIDMPLSEINIYDTNWIGCQENNRYNFTRALYVMKQLKKINNIRTVLDVGCGTGILVNILNQHGYMADGIDTSPEAIEFAQTNKRGNFYLTTIDRFINRHKYDIIIATQLIEHLRAPEVFLMNIKNLLKQGGYLYVETPNLYSWRKRSIWRKRIGGMFYGKDHRIVYSTKSLTSLLKKNNFNICSSFTKTFSPTIFIETLSNLIYKFERYPRTLNKPVLHDSKRINLVKKALKKIFEWVKYSYIMTIFLYIPNKISEINNHGNQLVVITNLGDNNLSV